MSVDEVIAKMYASMSFEPGGEPDWQAQREVFAGHARLVRVRDEAVFEFDPSSFRADFEQMIASGMLPSLYERELWHDAKLYGNVAHVLSAYEIRASRNGALVCRAMKSIQLFQKDSRWWISAMIWQREDT